MSARGPVPKRESQRRRRNKPESGEVTKASGAADVSIPKGNSKWHPIVKRWFASLAESGQSAFYEPSDWAAAEVIAESMSRDLRPQFVGLAERVDAKGTRTTEPVMVELPINGARMTAYLRGMTALLVTEADRRRAQVELDRPARDEGKEAAGVSWIDDARRRRGGAS